MGIWKNFDGRDDTKKAAGFIFIVVPLIEKKIENKNIKIKERA